MKLTFPRLAILGLAAGICVSAFAQNDVPVEYVPARNFTFSVGYRATSHGPKVRFGNLGNVPIPSESILPSSFGDGITRVYDNGSIVADAPRSDEVDADGNQITTPGGRYTTTTTTSTTDETTGETTTTTYNNGDRLAYTPGQTRTWTYSNANQLQPDGSIGFSQFSATSNGASASGEGGSEGGFEIKLERIIGKRGNRMEWGISGSFGLNDVNVKTHQRIRATLTTTTDYFRVAGSAPPPDAPYSAPPAGDDYTDPVTGTVTPGGTETTVPLINTPSKPSTTTTDVGGAEIDGTWQIKGAYYMARLGPTFRYNISDHFALSGGAGVTGAFVGTVYRVDETILIEGATQPLRDHPQERTSKFIPGYYGELNGEWWVTERTGFYLGAVFEKLGKYEQNPVGGRTASLDLGQGVGYRFGIVTRF
jgi:hypothetical protein